MPMMCSTRCTPRATSTGSDLLRLEDRRLKRLDERVARGARARDQVDVRVQLRLQDLLAEQWDGLLVDVDRAVGVVRVDRDTDADDLPGHLLLGAGGRRRLLDHEG